MHPLLSDTRKSLISHSVAQHPHPPQTNSNKKHVAYTRTYSLEILGQA